MHTECLFLDFQYKKLLVEMSNTEEKDNFAKNFSMRLVLV